MQHTEGLFNGKNEFQLYYQSWRPDVAPRAVIVLVHGFSDHCGRYEELVDALVRRRHAIFSFDLRGHGQSPGQRGHINHFDEYRHDTHLFIEFAAGQLPGLPLFLFGHSMGGLIALDQALAYPNSMSGVIASAPHLGNPPLSQTKQLAGRLLSRVWPSCSIEVGINEGHLSRDESVGRAYRDDPLVHGRGTPRLATELVTAVAETQARAHSLQVPLLIYVGTDDRITNPDDMQRFYNNVNRADKSIIIYEGGYHENHNDIHSERVVIEVAQWIEGQLIIAAHKQEQQDTIDG